MEINFNVVSNFHFKRITDFIAASFIYYLKNYRFILQEIILFNVISILSLVFLFVSFDGEFNLNFFLTNEGKIFVTISLLTVVFNHYNSAYKTFRLISLNNLEFRNLSVKLKILLIVILKFLLMILAISSIIFNERYIFILIVFLILNTFLYRKFYDSKFIIVGIVEQPNSLIRKIKTDIKTTFLIILNRLLITLIPLLATFSIFIVYEFVRILITGKIFFFVLERSTELFIFSVLMFVIFLLINPFQYFSVMIFYQYHYHKTKYSEAKKIE